VKASTILFDADRRIQIADFSPIHLETGEVEPFSDDEWAPTADVSGFASLLLEIAVSGTATPHIGAACGPPFPVAVPAFVSRMIEDGRSPESARRLSFAEIVAQLKANRFQIMAGVDSDEVSAFVSRVESSQQAGEGNKRCRCKSSRPTIESFSRTAARDFHAEERPSAL
jgi:hypothetical protein